MIVRVDGQHGFSIAVTVMPGARSAPTYARRAPTLPSRRTRRQGDDIPCAPGLLDGELPPKRFVDGCQRPQLGEEVAVLRAQLAALSTLFLKRRLQGSNLVSLVLAREVADRGGHIGVAVVDEAWGNADLSRDRSDGWHAVGAAHAFDRTEQFHAGVVVRSRPALLASAVSVAPGGGGTPRHTTRCASSMTASAEPAHRVGSKSPAPPQPSSCARHQ